VGRLATARRIKTAGRPRQPLLRQNRRFSSPHPFGRAGLARFEPRRLVSTLERRLPGENVCYLRNLGTDEPLTSMNGMARGRATSSLSQNRQNREPTRTGSRSGSCTDPRHRPAISIQVREPACAAEASSPHPIAGRRCCRGRRARCPPRSVNPRGRASLPPRNSPSAASSVPLE